jgi:hypothetical protein
VHLLASYAGGVDGDCIPLLLAALVLLAGRGNHACYAIYQTQSRPTYSRVIQGPRRAGLRLLMIMQCPGIFAATEPAAKAH